MQKKYQILAIVVLMFLAMSFSLVNAQNISMDQIKENIQKRLEQRNELIKDYQCDVFVKRMSSTPRGDMEMESNFKLYFKSPDKRKLEFIGGKRGNREIRPEDMNRRGRRGGQRRMRGFSSQPSHFDMSKYLNDLKMAGTEKVEGVDTYKFSIKVSDSDDRFKSLTVWIDQKTFDVVKYKGNLRKNERLQSGKVVRSFAPVGPQGAWMPVKEKSEQFTVFNTPMGEMDIESSGTTKFDNYKFNVGLKDEIFKAEK